MVWDAYTIFSVLTGAMLVGIGVLPVLDRKERVISLVGGIALIAYGLYVGHATSGTYPFPIWIFIAPFYFLFQLAKALWVGAHRGLATSRTAAQEPAEQAPAPESPTPAPVDRTTPDFGVGTAFSSSAVRSSPDPSRPFLYGNVERP